MRTAFTMIEMIFVMVIIGILASIALPKFAATRTDAQITKARADISSIRSAIMTERQSRLITGDSQFIPVLHSSSTSFFDGNGSLSLLTYAIVPQNADGHWHTAVTTGSSGAFTTTYQFKLLGVDNTFTYTQSDGKFDCLTATAPSCSDLTN